MRYCLLYTITPTLGMIRNYIKYKRCNLLMYLRTPFIYCLFHSLLWLSRSSNIVLKTLILERWYWFLTKSIRSFINRDYYKKQAKYKEKYNLTYPT